jgi:hypothetical protein
LPALRVDSRITRSLSHFSLGIRRLWTEHSDRARNGLQWAADRRATPVFAYGSRVISVSDYLYFVDDALDEMVAIVVELGDDLANQRPAGTGANSPFAILTHCLGVIECWAGELVAGREIERDRDAEFAASGDVQELVRRVEAARRQLRTDVSVPVPEAPLRNPPDPEDVDLPFGRRQGAALLHLYRELSQHLGQMEGYRDVMTADWAVLTS